MAVLRRQRFLVGIPNFNPFLVRIIKGFDFWVREVFDFCGWKLARIMQVGSTCKKIDAVVHIINVDKHNH